jgi:hypothetical protein
MTTTPPTVSPEEVRAMLEYLVDAHDSGQLSRDDWVRAREIAFGPGRVSEDDEGDHCPECTSPFPTDVDMFGVWCPACNWAFEEPTQHIFRITAEAWVDGHRDQSVVFNAARWFNQAADDEILHLATDGWGFDYGADAVAEDSAAWVPELAAMFRLKDQLNSMRDSFASDPFGFECEVQNEEAVRWLRWKRPALLPLIGAE